MSAAATLVSVNEYLATSYRPDRELIDGELLERNLGENDHSNLQMTLAGWLYARRKEWHIRVRPEQRVQVTRSRFRVPDIAVLSRDQPTEPILTRPPLVLIKVLSKDDTLRFMQDRIDDYLNFGVANIWLLDPASHRAYVCTRHTLREPEDGILQVPETPIRITLAELFAELD